MNTRLCGDRVPESKGQPLSSWDPSSPRLEARPLNYTPTQQAQECLHKAHLRQELWGPCPKPSMCAHAVCMRGPWQGTGGEVASHAYTHAHRRAGLSPGPRHCPLWALGPGQSENRWLYQPGQAGHGGMEFGQGLKDQHQGTTSARRGPVQAALPGCGGRAPVWLLPVPGRCQSW